MSKTKQKELHEYEVMLEASYYCTEEATVTVEAENAEQAEEMAISETQDGQHFGNGEFEGYNGWDSDVDLQALDVSRTDGEEEEDDDDE